jgi:DMSO/TMAO reductase YedYZ heme-binding membrane subunit
MSPHLAWYIARAAGITSWVLLSASVVWGLFLSTRAPRNAPAPWLLDLHRFLGGLAVVFVGVHLAALVGDNYTHWGLRDLFVPLASKWHPVAVVWGIVGFYLLLAVELTSLARDTLPKQTWHAIHMLSYPLFVVATVHLMFAGTDAHNRILDGALIVIVLAVVVLTTIRLMLYRLGFKNLVVAGRAAQAPPRAQEATARRTAGARH